MTAVVTANCPRCNADLKLRPDGVHVFLFSTEWPKDYYAFFCPKCKAYVQKDADDHITNLLLNNGVPHTMIEVPQEVMERRDSRQPVTNDDMINLVVYLRDHDTIPSGRAYRRATRK